MTKLDDWNHCRNLWAEHMRIEAADRGYDFAAGSAADERYRKACVEYEKKYGEPFSRGKEPEEPSIGDEVEELGLRVGYAEYLETCRGRGLEFEEWKVGRAG